MLIIKEEIFLERFYLLFIIIFIIEDFNIFLDSDETSFM